MRRLGLLAGLLGIGGLWWFSRSVLGLEFDAASLREMVASLGVWGPLAFVVLVTFRLPLGLPSQLVLTAGGLAFGALPGALLGALGLTGSGLVVFWLTRVAGPERALRSLPVGLAPVLDVARGRVGALFVALGIGYPVGPLTACQFAGAVTGMHLFTYLVACGGGGLVRAGLFSYFGDRLVSGEGLLGAGLALVLALGLPLCFPRARTWLRLAFGRSPQAAPPIGPLESDESR